MLHAEKTEWFELEVTVNGQKIKQAIPMHLRLLDFLRETLRLTGAKEVCGEGECGACTILLNGKAVNSCLIFAAESHGGTILTIEGLQTASGLNDVQQSFIDDHAVQCGYCIPGMILSVEEFLKHSPHPDREKIRHALAGNICRCTGYQKVVDAVENTAKKR
ncbi:MAG: (2Fe-2S)-binding protein [Candidatus Marinimicrobia bacterium]|nr:(2Fe-2S)-binding protein [Candidatus Neomarinimicrobiota bacterium]MCF7840100.1 (2Fe-2S)-binding protein [Candidatus Neomarinimicrobiota bacterium]MCF7903112.1 (2Fe-2S)-binding protein [Candidatus Neomarinimicrobiota bacterium]